MCQLPYRDVHAYTSTALWLQQLFERDDTIVQLQHKLDMAQIDGRLQRDQEESFIHSDKVHTY